MLREIKHCALDFDGVVVDSTGKCVEEIEIVTKSLIGESISREKILSMWGVTFADLLDKIFPQIDLLTYFNERKRLGLDRVFPSLIPGAIEAIETLSERISFSLITNRDKTTLFEIIEYLGIDKSLFENIQDSSATLHHKPHPGVFNDLLTFYNAKKVIYVGDHLVDHQASWGAGINFAGVLSGGITTRKDFVEAGVSPEMIINSLADLPSLFNIAD